MLDFDIHSGIGIVNAIEVLQAFPEEDGLQKFREWLESPDPSILGQFGSYTGSKSMKRSSKTSNSNVDELTDNSEESACEESGLRNHGQVADNGIPDVKNIFMNKHVSPYFPSLFLKIFLNLFWFFFYSCKDAAHGL